jgi:hypothetical protein
LTENFVFYFIKIVLAILGLLNFHMKFWNSFSISAKKQAGVWIGITLNLYVALGRIAS